MPEVINIHIGQAGLQVGNACWELYCLEHGIRKDGIRQGHADIEERPTFFYETSRQKYVPHALFVDLEPTVGDQIRTGSFRQLFHPDQIITGKEDAANNFARGYYGIGREMVDLVLDRVRKMVDTCQSSPQGFIIFNSLGGGTGSGFTGNLIERLCLDYPKTSKFQVVVYPSPLVSSAIVEPYNALMTTHATLEYSDCAIIFDNQAMYAINRRRMLEPSPTFKNINTLTAQVISSITGSLRFRGALNSDLTEIQTNLVPYPRIHFPIVAYAPFHSSREKCPREISTIDLTRLVFRDSSFMVTCMPRYGKYMSCCLLYRGQTNNSDIYAGIQKVRASRAIKFVNWSPTGFKISVNNTVPRVLPGGDLARVKQSACMIGNSTSIVDVWSRLIVKFGALFQRRAFVHWYVGEGMEEDEFVETQQDLMALENDYNEVGLDTEPDSLNRLVSKQSDQSDKKED